MLLETSNNIKKLLIISRFIEVLHLFCREQVNDHCKRSILRFFFIQIDNLLQIVPRTKNNLFRECLITQKQKKEIERLTKVLSKSYDNSYDTIRDKIGAHNQPVDLISLLNWWHEIDFTTVEVLYEDATSLLSSFSDVNCVKFPVVPNYAPIAIPSNSKFASDATKPSISTDRLAAMKPNTMCMIPCHPSQEKAQLILSIIEFLEIDFSLWAVVDEPSTIYHATLYDVAWLLAIVDTCSLLDNLFEDTHYDMSLFNHWKAIAVAGCHNLEDCRSKRDLEFESSLRNIRNTLGAHIDDRKPFQELYKKYLKLDLAALHKYAYIFINCFRTACRQDFRTKMFDIHNMPVDGVISVPNWTEPFDK